MNSPPPVDQNREKQLPLSPTGENARILGTDSHKLQLMKASFFDGSDEEINEVYDQGKSRLRYLFVRVYSSNLQLFNNFRIKLRIISLRP